MMDEPTSNLDFGNQAKVLAAVRKLADQGMGIIMTTHDPDHVFLCNANVILMMRGGEILTGTADEIVTPEHMLQAYSVPVLVEQININNKKTKVCQPVLY
jgi:iron complex transport system ATP-binding protein